MDLQKELANLIFPNIDKTVEDYKKLYPERNLKEGAKVTRFAPSPTGFMHIGNFCSALVDYVVAKSSDGVFYLRNEDTDQKRKVEGAVELILNTLEEYHMIPDEFQLENKIVGEYGPYVQSERKEIYHAFIKHLIEIGRAYPCFCDTDQLEELRKVQESGKQRTGYYGRYATCRRLKVEEQIQKVKEGIPYVIRFKSEGSHDEHFFFDDLVRGRISLPQNDQDIIIMKSESKLPTYHFAHVVDDMLMHTTHVVRGEEWLPSVPIHIELFRAFDEKPPKYIHIPLILKKDGETIRKISKRKDPEAAVSYYHEEGIPEEAVVEYLLNIANSSFEPWRRANKDADISEFKLELNKMSVSGAVFDMVKLLDVSKNVISKFTAEKIYEEALKWAKRYDEELVKMLTEDKEYAMKILNIERGGNKPRKDISKWAEIKHSIEYMYDEVFDKNTEYEFQNITDKEEIKEILSSYLTKHFDINDDKQTWFDKMKDLAEERGYAREVKEYKANPENYKGHVGDISTVIRVALTGRHNTPDLYEIMQILGKDRIEKRINKICGGN